MDYVRILVLQVHVDKGMKDGQRITFRGESNQVTCATICILWGIQPQII